MRRVAIGILALLAAACSGGTPDQADVTGSRSAATTDAPPVVSSLPAVRPTEPETTARTTDPFWDHLVDGTANDVRPVVAAALRTCRGAFDVDVSDEVVDRLESTASERRPARHHELTRFERYRAVNRALGRRPSTFDYAGERLVALRRRIGR